jgi:TrpR-related protein YerC/YecD
MAKKSFTEGTWRTDPWFRTLCRALASCKTEAEVADFLRDVGTLSELQAWSERLEVARRVAAGETYRSIMETTGASTTTVTRVARFFEDGAGGYRRFLKDHQHTVSHARHHRAGTARGKRLASTS